MVHEGKLEKIQIICNPLSTPYLPFRFAHTPHTTVRSVHKKHKELVHLLQSGGERVEGERSLKRLNSLKWKERKGGKEEEREKEREKGE